MVQTDVGDQETAEINVDKKKKKKKRSFTDYFSSASFK